MAVIGFRTHTFQYISEKRGYVNGDGDFVPGSIVYSDNIYCNAVPNSGEAVVIDAEGNKTSYSFTIYAEPTVRDFSFGEMIRLNREGIVYELTVKGFHRYSNMVKIWV